MRYHEQFGELILYCPLSIRMMEGHRVYAEMEKRLKNDLIKYTCAESSRRFFGRKSSCVTEINGSF